MADAGKIAPTYENEWSASVAYDFHSYVTHNGNCYIAKQPSTGVEPVDEENEYWFLAMKNVTQEQYNNIINGTTTVGNSASLGGETSAQWQSKLDNIQTTSRGTLSQAGWYRVAEYTVANTAHLKGHATNSCRLLISRPIYNRKGEEHEIKLMSTYNSQEFIAISDKSDEQLVTKVRYASDGSKDYLEVYYNVKADNGVLIEITNGTDYRNGSWKAITPTLTSETVDGVTVTCTYDIPANASPVTDLDIKDNILYYALTEGFDLNNAFGTYATSSGNITNSLLNKPSTVTTGDTYIKWLPALGTVYGMQVLYNSAYNSSESKYVTTIYIRSYSGSWGDWKTLATTADLANYLPLSGGVIKGNIRQLTGENGVSYRMINNKRDTEFYTSPNGDFSFYDNTNGKNIIESTANGTTTFNGTATGNLPLSGGTIGNGKTNYPILVKGGAGYSFVEFSNADNTVLGALGMYGVDKPSFIVVGREKAYDLHHDGNSAKVAIQSSAPSDTSALWVDTANKVIKAYIDGAWTQVS